MLDPSLTLGKTSTHMKLANLQNSQSKEDREDAVSSKLPRRDYLGNHEAAMQNIKINN